MKSIMHKAKEWLGLKSDLTVDSKVQAEFFLFLSDLLVGTLTVHDARWEFKYSDEFKRRPEFRPLVEFPDLEKVYENEQLWQFFAARIPSTEQPEVEEVLRRENISEDDLVGLLRQFGTKTIANPFRLQFKQV